MRFHSRSFDTNDGVFEGTLMVFVHDTHHHHFSHEQTQKNKWCVDCYEDGFELVVSCLLSVVRKKWELVPL